MPVAVDDGSLAKWRVSPSHPHWRSGSTSVDDAPELDKIIVSRHLLLIYDLETTITYVLLAISTLNASSRSFSLSSMSCFPLRDGKVQLVLSSVFWSVHFLQGRGGGVESSCCDFGIRQALKKMPTKVTNILIATNLDDHNWPTMLRLGGVHHQCM